jgi:hypothetical protein
VLTIWDVLARRAAFPARAGRSAVIGTGLAGRPVPVEQDAPAGAVPKLLILETPSTARSSTR